MPRNLDMTALRSFVAVAEEGGVTRAAGFLNLTQSAVSMQLKRLEEMLDVQLLDRSARTIALTANGEQLLSYARRMIQLNDEVYGRLTANEFEGEIALGVPHDIVYPAMPQVLRRFANAYPRVKVQLISSFTISLKEQFARGEVDIMLTTEDTLDAGGEVVSARDMVWIGAPGGQAHKQRPLRLAFEHNCMFRRIVQDRLDAENIPWEMAVESNSTRTIEATVSADLAVHAMLAGTVPPYCTIIDHHGTLPKLSQTSINMYCAGQGKDPVIADLAEMVRVAYRSSAVDGSAGAQLNLVSV